MGPPVANNAVNVPPINPKGAAHHLLIGSRGSLFLCQRTRSPLAAAKQPKVNNNGSLGALMSKTMPNTIPIKLNGKSHFNSLKFASAEDFLPTYRDAQMSIMTIIGTTTFSGYIWTSKGTATIDEPNPEIPKIK